MAVPKKAKMADLVNYRLRVVTLDGRQLTGQMLAFDKYMNLVLADTEEFRQTKKSKGSDPSSFTEDKRALGLIILRGLTIVSVSVEAPPPTDPTTRLGGLQPGPGVARAATRAIPGSTVVAAPSLSGPVRTNFQGSPPTGPASMSRGGAPPAYFGGPGFQAPPGFGGR